MKHYEISVVTPLHNTDLNVFRAGVESMKTQTLGFENIEWVVVLHNCTEDVKAGVHEMLDGYENVILHELENDRKTPSSPRNCGLKMVTGDYVGFLDADDSYTPECMETVLEALKRNQARIAVFRREFELEDPNATPVTEIVLWDQMQKEILVNREGLKKPMWFKGVCGMVTSRIYDREFLNENHVMFDEEVLFGEDFLFNLTAYGYVDRVVYLPQFIGYHYYINKGSLVQSSEKPPETLIAYARGYTKIFDMGLKNGFYMNAIISRLCVVLSRFLAQSTALTMEQRLEIRDILEPYISQTVRETPCKVYPPRACREMYEIPRRVILDPETWAATGRGLLVSDQEADDPMRAGMLHTLTDILDKNQGTDVGRHYAFQEIFTVDDYRRMVPLSCYEEFAPLVKLTTRIGESSIFTAETIAAYISREADDEEKIQIFPLTARQARGNARVFSRLMKDHRTILLPDKAKEGPVRYNDAVYANTMAGTIDAMLFSHIPGIETPKVTAPSGLFFTQEDYDTRYLHMLFALRSRKADQIIQPKLRWTLRVFTYLEENWQVMCDDMEHGTVSMGEPLPESLRDIADRYLRPDPERAGELCAVFEEGFDSPVAKRIWPKLHTVWTNTGKDRQARQLLQERYLGEVPCRDLYYETCGTIIGMSEKHGSGFALKLLHQAAFMEFIPEEAMCKETPQTLTVDAIRIGETYEVVLTSLAGLYRFRTGDRIRVTDLSGGEVWFEEA